MRSSSKYAFLFLAFISLAVGACTQQSLTGALEEEDLYNTNGLHGRALFDPDGLAPVAVATRPFARVGLMWDAPTSTRLRGRIQLGDGTWGAWQTIRPRFSEGGFHTSHLDVSGHARAFQLRLVQGAAPAFLLVEGIEQIGELVEPEPAESQGRFSNLRQALAPASLVHPRSDWGARNQQCNPGGHSPAKITIHHTATPLPDSVSVITRLRGIQSYHMDTRGYCDIAYHYLVDWNGEIWQGRPETTLGGHVLNNNTNNVGISFIGTYNGSAPTGSQLGTTADLVDWLSSTYGIPKDRSHLWGHREYRGNNAGDCPGDLLQARLGDLLTGGGGVEPTHGHLRGAVFFDQGSGTDDMSVRLPGATISVAGHGNATAEGADAMWSLELPAGTYTASASANGYQTGSRTCSVTAGQDSWCSIGLRAEAAGTGRLIGSAYVDRGDGDMSERLPGAVVSVPGNGQATAREGDAVWSFDLLPGSYTPSASAPGFVPATRTCEVTTGQDTWCSIGLRPEDDDPPDDPVDPDLGEDPEEPVDPGLIFGSVLDLGAGADALACTGATISAAIATVGGESAPTDADGYFEFWLPAGAHNLVVTAEGYLQAEVTCTVEAGGSQRCCVGLEPDAPEDEPDPPSDPIGPVDPISDDEVVIQGGCASAPGPAPASGLVALLLLGYLTGRSRRTGPPPSA